MLSESLPTGPLDLRPSSNFENELGSLKSCQLKPLAPNVVPGTHSFKTNLQPTKRNVKDVKNFPILSKSRRHLYSSSKKSLLTNIYPVECYFQYDLGFEFLGSLHIDSYCAYEGNGVRNIFFSNLFR